MLMFCFYVDVDDPNTHRDCLDLLGEKACLACLKANENCCKSKSPRILLLVGSQNLLPVVY